MTYNLPIEKVYELRSKLSDVEIKPYGKPRSSSYGPAYVSGYRIFNKAIPINQWEEDSWKPCCQTHTKQCYSLPI